MQKEGAIATPKMESGAEMNGVQLSRLMHYNRLCIHSQPPHPLYLSVSPSFDSQPYTVMQLYYVRRTVQEVRERISPKRAIVIDYCIAIVESSSRTRDFEQREIHHRHACTDSLSEGIAFSLKH